MTSFSLMALEIRTGDPAASWMVGRALVLELLRLHGGDLEAAAAAWQGCRFLLQDDPATLEVYGESEGDDGVCEFSLRIPGSGPSEPCPLGSGRSRPLP